MTFASLAFAAILMAGCETESADSADVTISPTYAQLSHGQSVTLTAHGWDNFSWSADHGQLSASKGKSVVFTAVGISGSNTCTVTATALSGSSSNSVASGTATIEVH